jgi:ketosteroid isomerase-like protein
VAEKIGLLQSDKAFSDLSMQKGMKAAFLEVLDSNAVLIRSNYLPIVGANAIDYLLQQNDTSYSINWQPQQAVVSQSADMGYTFGIYAVRPKYQDTVLYGTYVNIWKKDVNGVWKIVLDTGNEGIDSSNTTF